jgi:hypothetical protein
MADVTPASRSSDAKEPTSTSGRERDSKVSRKPEGTTSDNDWQKFPDDYWRKLPIRPELEEEIGTLFGAFESLQRENLVHLQNRLAKIKGDMSLKCTTSQEQMESLSQTLHNYSKPSDCPAPQFINANGVSSSSNTRLRVYQ